MITIEKLTILPLATVLVASFLGCGDDTPRTGGVALDSFCDRLARETCMTRQRCGCEPGVDMATCVTTVAQMCPLRPGEPARIGIDDGTFPYEPLSAERLAAWTGSIECNESLDCGTAFTCVGLSLEGGACGQSFGCAVGTRCVDSICQAFAAEGGVCIADEDCVDRRCKAAVCTAPLPLGSACGENADCQTGRCMDGSCGEAAEIGSSCVEDSECQSTRCDFAVGRCAALIADDELCADDGDCMSANCDTGFCKGRVAVGESCGTNDDCESGQCTAALCVTPVCT